MAAWLDSRVFVCNDQYNPLSSANVHHFLLHTNLRIATWLGVSYLIFVKHYAYGYDFLGTNTTTKCLRIERASPFPQAARAHNFRMYVYLQVKNNRAKFHHNQINYLGFRPRHFGTVICILASACWARGGWKLSHEFNSLWGLGHYLGWKSWKDNFSGKNGDLLIFDAITIDFLQLSGTWE